VRPGAQAAGSAATAAESLAALAAIDHAVFGFTRDADHTFLLHERRGYLYRWGGEVVGYGYVGEQASGPFAVLHTTDFPAVLAHAETEAATAGVQELALMVPMINAAAVSYLLARQYQLGGFLFFMSDTHFAKFEQHIQCDPPVFL
jgi:hypothetical protein